MSMKKIRGALIAFILIILVGGGVYSYLESWTIVDGLYFSTVTVTTLGYGDLVPTRPLTKIVTIFFSLSGITIGLYILTVMGKYMASELQKKKEVVKLQKIRRGHSFDVSKLNIGQEVEWYPGKGIVYDGRILGLNLDKIKFKPFKKDNKLLPKNKQEIITISSKGRLMKAK